MNATTKAAWHRQAIALLGKVSRQLEIPTGERTIRSNKAGPAVGGEVTMSAPKFGIYIHLSCPIDGYGNDDASYWAGTNFARGCDEKSPYGSALRFPNRSLPATPTLEDIVSLARFIKANPPAASS